WSTSKTPSYTKSVSWQHHRLDEVGENFIFGVDICDALYHAICRPQRERMNVSLASTDLSIKALGF
ncbi:hypothetical protein M4Z49_17360, partial [Escherichia coli]|uniref:hypothetical protein n=1 Tax=Escherichia coli TaxID=562 RepID=UPI002018AEA9